ncbi:MAG: tRNA pseudouridine(55) synthase TruB [Calditrichaeota bacterium]|nr:MAG: tRNA pseudouridine(55) synthase TruB [Calditrichota bacterium]
MGNQADRYNGILLVNKETGMTSHDIVSRLRRILKQKRIGHCGTLDKAASGLLIVCLGKATKASQFITDSDKEYIATIEFGRTSKTYDAEGVDFETSVNKIPELSMEYLNTELDTFRGTIEQTVPFYSAIHVDGKRLYKLAKEGRDVELPKREITISDIEILKISNTAVKIKVACTKGTYIRSLAHDLGQQIGCSAYLSALLRTKIGKLHVDASYTLAEIEKHTKDNMLENILMSYDDVLPFAVCTIADEYINSVFEGRDIQREYISNISGSFLTGDKVSLRDNNGNILAVCSALEQSDRLELTDEDKLFKYIRVLH